MSHKYKIRYKIGFETREHDYRPEDCSDEQGLTDGLAVFSMLYPEDGSCSQQLNLALDGRTNEAMEPNDLFKLWMMMGLGMADSGDFTGGRQNLLQVFATMIREIFKSQSPNE